MSSEMVVYDHVSDPLAFCQQMGTALAKSGMFNLPNVEAGQVVALTCMAEKITPIDFLRRYHIILGRPSMRSDAMLAEFRMREGSHKVVKRDSDGASVSLTLAGETFVSSITWEEAQKEPYVWATKDEKGNRIPPGTKLKDNWATPRARTQMMWARAVSDGIRVICPEIVAGVYTPEETMDFPDPTSVAPAEPRKTAEQIREELKQQQSSGTVIEATSFTTAEPEKGRPEKDVTTEQLMELQSLCDQCSIPWPPTKALSKRGFKSVEDLTKPAAEEMLENLRQRKRQGN